MAQTTVNFNLKTAGFAPYASQTLTFILLNAGADKTDDSVTLSGTVTATSAADGTGSVALFTNGDSDIDSVFEVVFPNRERSKFIIPASTSTISLSHLLVDHVPSGAATQQSSVYAAAIQRANHTGTQALNTISDAGTMAPQNSNSVSISGGSISGVTLTASTANLSDSTNKNLITDEQKAKINSVASGASVTDQTTVANAGALMTSTITNVSGIKTLTLPDSTEISTFAKDSLLNASAAEIKTTLGIVDATSQVNFVPLSISFTDINAFLSIADDVDGKMDVGTGDFSLSFAARLYASGTQPVLQKNGSAGYAVSFINGDLTLTLNNGTSANFTLATGLNDNKWHTYVITVDRDDNALAYVDSVAQTATARPVSGKAGDLNNTSPLDIGKVGSSPGTGISLGNYVALHKDELTASQAAQIYFSADAALTVLAPTLMVDLRRADKTFTDVSASGLAVTTNGTIIFNEGRITSLTGTTITASTKFVGAIDGTIGATTPAAVTGTNVLATTTLGYKAGSGGTFDQSDTVAGTGKAKAVLLNKINGEIVMDDAELQAGTSVAFTLTNSTIAATDVVIVNIASVGTPGSYQVTVGAVASGSCSISVLNATASPLSQAIKLNFAVIKAVKT